MSATAGGACDANSEGLALSSIPRFPNSPWIGSAHSGFAAAMIVPEWPGRTGFRVVLEEAMAVRRFIAEVGGPDFCQMNPLTSWMRQVEDFQRAA